MKVVIGISLVVLRVVEEFDFPASESNPIDNSAFAHELNLLNEFADELSIIPVFYFCSS